ncbi:hypothetical protein PIB30_111571, partial [Stylosanthes scabra]|nr:hypothetical protein [Stylosanthes scabra]
DGNFTRTRGYPRILSVTGNFVDTHYAPAGAGAGIHELMGAGAGNKVSAPWIPAKYPP